MKMMNLLDKTYIFILEDAQDESNGGCIQWKLCEEWGVVVNQGVKGDAWLQPTCVTFQIPFVYKQKRFERHRGFVPTGYVEVNLTTTEMLSLSYEHGKLFAGDFENVTAETPTKRILGVGMQSPIKIGSGP